MFNDRQLGWNRRRALGAGLIVTTSLVLAGCGSSHGATSSVAGNVPVSTSPTDAASAGPAASRGVKTKTSADKTSPSMAAGTATRPANPLAREYTPVERGGKRPHPSIHAKSQPFNKIITYSDGLGLQIKAIRHGVEAGYGRGVFHGSPTTQLLVKMTNHTKKAIDLGQVVVQMDYGRPSRVAPPVYDSAASDFSGVLKAGKSQTATYVFSVPTPRLGEVTMTVDMDSTHVAATFTGSVKN